jgi:ADP-ribosylglycohydrolase
MNETGIADRVRGCVIGGAVGDALGANVEFMSDGEIRRRFGPAGVRDFVGGSYPAGSITDDTQMTLFTAEGFIRALARYRDRGICHPPAVVWRAYLRWLVTQDGNAPVPADFGPQALGSGWLVHEPVLHHERAPGTTCLAALRSGMMGSIGNPINGSKGCGGVMRVAPIALAKRDRVFELAAECAATTHGHPSGYLAAGAFALIVHRVLDQVPLAAAIEDALMVLAGHDGGDETIAALLRAQRLATERVDARDAVAELGGGWVAEEALAIAVYCALACGDVRDALTAAVTHGGDSDSTGAICGNLIGAMYGAARLPTELVEQVEARGVLERISRDLVSAFVDGRMPAGYPPN